MGRFVYQLIQIFRNAFWLPPDNEQIRLRIGSKICIVVLNLSLYK